MPIKIAGRYEEGSDQDRAHKLLGEHDIAADHVYGVELQESGLEEITFTWNGKAQTAVAKDGRVEHVIDGWDVLPPRPVDGTWRGGY